MHVCSSFAGLHGSQRTLGARARLWAVARGPEQPGAQKGGCLRPARGRGQHPGALQVAVGSWKPGFSTCTNCGTQHGSRYKSAKLGATWSRLRLGLYLQQTSRPGERKPRAVPSTGFQRSSWEQEPAAQWDQTGLQHSTPASRTAAHAQPAYVASTDTRATW